VPHEVVPGRPERLVVNADVQADQHRPGVSQQDEVLRVVRGPLSVVRRLRVLGGARPAGAEGRETEGDEQRRAGQLQRFHATTSLIGLAVGSVMRTGRPMCEPFGLVMSIPRARPTVARKSWPSTGRSVTSVPSALVLPTTWPPLTPPPARTVLHDLAQWSR